MANTRIRLERIEKAMAHKSLRPLAHLSNHELIDTIIDRARQLTPEQRSEFSRDLPHLLLDLHPVERELFLAGRDAEWRTWMLNDTPFNHRSAIKG